MKDILSQDFFKLKGVFTTKYPEGDEVISRENIRE